MPSTSSTEVSNATTGPTDDTIITIGPTDITNTTFGPTDSTIPSTRPTEISNTTTTATQGTTTGQDTPETTAPSSTVATTQGPSSPVITRGPVMQPYYLGDPVNLTCSAIGSPLLVYRWHRDDELLTGENCPYLYRESVSLDDRGYYRCSVTNNIGTSASSNILLTISGE